ASVEGRRPARPSARGAGVVWMARRAGAGHHGRVRPDGPEPVWGAARRVPPAAALCVRLEKSVSGRRHVGSNGGRSPPPDAPDVRRVGAPLPECAEPPRGAPGAGRPAALRRPPGFHPLEYADGTAGAVCLRLGGGGRGHHPAVRRLPLPGHAGGARRKTVPPVPRPASRPGRLLARVAGPTRAPVPGLPAGHGPVLHRGPTGDARVVGRPGAALVRAPHRRLYGGSL